MKNFSPPRLNQNFTNFYTQDNCDCKCHFPEDIKMNKNNLIYQNIHTVHSISPCHSHSPDRIAVSSNQNKKIQNMQTNKSNASLCVCDNICSCPCHCITCVCCPCVKDRPQMNGNVENYPIIKEEINLEENKNINLENNNNNIEKFNLDNHMNN